MTIFCLGWSFFDPGRGGGTASRNLVAAGRQSSAGHQGCAPDLPQQTTPSFWTLIRSASGGGARAAAPLDEPRSR